MKVAVALHQVGRGTLFEVKIGNRDWDIIISTCDYSLPIMQKLATMPGLQARVLWSEGKPHPQVYDTHLVYHAEGPEGHLLVGFYPPKGSM